MDKKELYGSVEFTKEELDLDDGLTFHEWWKKIFAESKEDIEELKKKYKIDYDNQRDASA